jgi:hypothetical protein
MDDKEAAIRRKVRKAFHLLLFRRHRLPGVKGWELRKALGKAYPEILEILHIELDPLGLEVKTLYEEGTPEEPGREKRDRARYLITLKTPEVEIPSGMRIDDVAALAATLAYLTARRGKAPRREVEELLRGKFPRWKVDRNLERFIQRGYLALEEEVLSIGWRTRAEVDSQTLLNLILSA